MEARKIVIKYTSIAVEVSLHYKNYGCCVLPNIKTSAFKFQLFLHFMIKPQLYHVFRCRICSPASWIHHQGRERIQRGRINASEEPRNIGSEAAWRVGATSRLRVISDLAKAQILDSGRDQAFRKNSGWQITTIVAEIRRHYCEIRAENKRSSPSTFNAISIILSFCRNSVARAQSGSSR